MPYYLHLISVILPVAMLMFGLKMKNLERFQYNNDAGAVIVSLVVIFLFRAISELRSIENGFYYLVSVVLVSWLPLLLTHNTGTVKYLLV